MIEHVDGAADVERAAAQHGDDLLGDRPGPRVQRVERIVGRLLHVEDLLDGAIAEAPGELAADAPAPPRPPSGGSSVISRTVSQPASVTMTASARSSSSGRRSTRAIVVCLSGGASRSPVSWVTRRQMRGRLLHEAVDPPTRAAPSGRRAGGGASACGGGNEST